MNSFLRCLFLLLELKSHVVLLNMQLSSVFLCIYGEREREIIYCIHLVWLSAAVFNDSFPSLVLCIITLTKDIQSTLLSSALSFQMFVLRLQYRCRRKKRTKHIREGLFWLHGVAVLWVHIQIWEIILYWPFNLESFVSQFVVMKSVLHGWPNFLHLSIDPDIVAFKFETFQTSELTSVAHNSSLKQTDLVCRSLAALSTG